MIAKCFRFKGNSRDEFLLVQEYVPILNLLKEHTKIHTIILTGNSPAGSAHHHFYQYLVMNKKAFNFSGTEDNLYYGEILVGKRRVKIYRLNSTSARGSDKKRDRLLQQYKWVFQ